MLNSLFGSQARVKILKIFLLNPDNQYYIRQLARDLKLQVNSVRRELENLENFGLLTTDPNRAMVDSELLEREFKNLSGDEIRLFDASKMEAENKKKKEKKVEKEKGNKQEKKYYQVNKKFILYKEIRELFIKSQILSGRSFIKKLYKICQPKYLALAGIFLNRTACTDILIVGRVNKVKLLKIIAELEQEMGKEVNYTVMGLKEFKYRREVTDVFLYNFLQGKKIVLIDEIIEKEN